eukprot:354529-Amphidinium_carterae.1
MGIGPSKEEIEAKLQAEEDKLKREWESSKLAVATLDSKTRVPHLLIEIRSLGFVEIQGKDTGGIYQKLDEWLARNWRCEKVQTHYSKVAVPGCCGATTGYGPAPLEDHQRLCDVSYRLGPGVYKARGEEGENNMGKLSMQLAQFMTHECGWTFQVCDSGNLGRYGQIREEQLKFKAPH